MLQKHIQLLSDVCVCVCVHICMCVCVRDGHMEGLSPHTDVFISLQLG